MLTDVKILNKMLAKQIQQHIKKLYDMTMWNIFNEGSMVQHKKNNHMIISIGTEKTFDKLQHMIKKSQKARTKRKYIQHDERAFMFCVVLF